MLVNEKNANQKVATIYGVIEFNGKGEAKGLTQAQEKELAKLPGYRYVEEKKEVPKKEETKKEDAPKKRTARGTRKAAPKAEEK